MGSLVRTCLCIFAFLRPSFWRAQTGSIAVFICIKNEKCAHTEDAKRNKQQHEVLSALSTAAEIKSDAKCGQCINMFPSTARP